MRHDAEISTQDPAGMKGTYPCPECGRETSHSVLAIVNSRHFDESGLAQFWDHYLTVRCNGCGTVSFCHASKCGEEEDLDERGNPFLVQHKKHYPGFPEAGSRAPDVFVEASRIAELEAAPRDRFDATRLAQMLAELNRAYIGHSFLSCALLIRAILDHVPPIFGLGSFSEVANNYAGGGRSFRESMQHLQNSSRKIADSYLHSQIRGLESVPTKTQVEFRADIDVLIGEVIRILRGKP
ncbi:MAG: hypothetical protein ACREC3_04985 [Methyloceanibacter sp.]